MARLSLSEILEIFGRRRTVAAIAAVFGIALAIAVVTLIPRTFLGTSRVLIVNENTGHDPSVTTNDLPEVASSSVVILNAERMIGVAIPLVDVRKRLTAKVASHSSIMDIAYKDTSPEVAVAFPNAIADELTQYIGQISTQRYNENVENLDKQIAAQQQRLNVANQRLHDIAGSTPDALNTTTDFGSRLRDLQVQRALAASTLSADQATLSRTGNSAEVAPKVARHETLENDPAYKTLRDAVAKDSTELAIEEASFSRNYPGLPELRLRVATERAQLAAQSKSSLDDSEAYSDSAAASDLQAQKNRATVEGDSARVHQLDDVIAQQTAAYNATTGAQSNVDKLQTARDAAKADLTTYMSRRALAIANRAEAASLGSVVVVDRAVAAPPQFQLGHLLGAIVGLVIVIFVVALSIYLAEILDPRLSRPDHISNLYGRPVVADIGAL